MTEKPELLPEKTRPKWQKTVGTILFVLTNIGVIAVTAILEFSKDASHAKRIPFLGLNFRYLFAAVACVLVFLAAETLKYFYMMKKTVGVSDFKTAFEVMIIGKYYDNITPLGAGGQPFQIFFLNKKGFSKGAAASLPVSAFLSHNLAFSLLAIVVFVLRPSTVESVAVRIAALVGLGCYLFVPVVIVLFTVAPKAAEHTLRVLLRLLAGLRIIKNRQKALERSMEFVNEYRGAFRQMAAQRGVLLLLLGLSVVYQVAMCSLPFFVLRAFGGAATWVESFCICIFIYAAVTFIPTPGNSGAAEGSFYALFSGLTSSYLFWAMLVWRFFCYYLFLLLGGCVFAFRALTRRRR